MIFDAEVRLPASLECNIRIFPSSTREFWDPENSLGVCLKAVIFFLGIPLSLSAWVVLLVIFLFICLGGYISADLQLEYSEACREAMAPLFCARIQPVWEAELCKSALWLRIRVNRVRICQQDLYHCSLGLDEVLSWLSPGWTTWLSLLISWPWLGMFPGTEAGHCSIVSLCL